MYTIDLIADLKKLSQQFVYDLAKSDLFYCYKQCLDGIEEVKRRGWDIFNGMNSLTARDKLLARYITETWLRILQMPYRCEIYKNSCG
jgi:hypothetical protein